MNYRICTLFFFQAAFKYFFSFALWVFPFLAALLVTPQTKLMLVQTTLSMLLYKKRKSSTFAEEKFIFGSNILQLLVFLARHALLPEFFFLFWCAQHVGHC